MITLLVFLLILSVLVLIHEAGHFFVARKFGIKVEEFGFGIPPRAWGKKIGETLYSINWLPIGGFVKLFGEDEAGAGRIANSKSQIANSKKDLSRAFFARPVWQRALVVVAGVVMNALLAFLIYYIFLVISGFKTEIPLHPLTAEYQFFGVQQTNKLDSLIVVDVLPNSPAAKAGVKSCKVQNNKPVYCLELVSISGQKMETVEEFQETLKDSRGKKTTFVWENLADKKKVTTSIIPRVNPPKGQGAIGIRFNTQEVTVLEYKTPLQKLFSGIVHPINVMVYQFDILGQLLKESIVKQDVKPVGSAFSGPVGVFVVTGQVLQIPDVKERLLAVLNLAGLLSASLALFNILPIPALDGGRLFFILLEGITGRKVNQKTEALIHSVGMVMLLGLILLITFKDIFQFFIK